MPDFSSLQIALSSIYAQRKALQVTGQNIANVNTEEYSRQRITMTANPGAVTPSTQWRATGLGMGVLVGDTVRVRDEFLERRAYQEHAVHADLQARQNALTLIEFAFDEPSDFGLSKLVNRFLAAFDDVANHPDDPGPRPQLVEQGSALLAGFTQLDTALAAQHSSSLAVLAAQVDDVNSTAAHLADLNRNIRSAVADGFSANELMGQRALLIGRLAEQIGVTAVPRGNGDIDVFAGGRPPNDLMSARCPFTPSHAGLRLQINDVVTLAGHALDSTTAAARWESRSSLKT